MPLRERFVRCDRCAAVHGAARSNEPQPAVNDNRSQIRQQSMEPYGAPWLQLATTGCRSHCPKKRGNKRKPLPWVATGCRREHMVRRGSTVRVRQRALQKSCRIGLFFSALLARLTACGAFRSRSAFRYRPTRPSGPDQRAAWTRRLSEGRSRAGMERRVPKST